MKYKHTQNKSFTAFCAAAGGGYDIRTEERL